MHKDGLVGQRVYDKFERSTLIEQSPPLPAPPLSPQQVGKLRREYSLLMKMGSYPNMTADQKQERWQQVLNLLEDYEHQKRQRYAERQIRLSRKLNFLEKP